MKLRHAALPALLVILAASPAAAAGIVGTWLAPARSAHIKIFHCGEAVCGRMVSATVIIPRFGAASFVAFILVAQLLTSSIVDQFGLFGVARRPVDAAKLIGLSTIALGIAIMEIGNLRKALP